MKLYIIGGLALLLAGCGGRNEANRDPGSSIGDPLSDSPSKAKAVLSPTEGHKARGTVTFERQEDGSLRVYAELSGLTPGAHGFHIHETGDCSDPMAKSAGGHFNPDGGSHGSPRDANSHAGDLGNVVADSEGNARAERQTQRLTLTPGTHSVVGRAVIVHARVDNETAQPAGAAGDRVACGVVAL